MPDVPVLPTDRVVLRGWTLADREAFAALNADLVTMEHLPGTLTREESDALVDAIEAEFDEFGYGLWAVEVPGDAPFIGFVGFHWARFDAPFTPAVEIGWRIHQTHWGHGYATEAAREVLRFGFEQAGLNEVVSFTSVAHAKSRAVMERLGLAQVGDFEHPRLPEGHRLRHHVLYRIDRDSWKSATG